MVSRSDEKSRIKLGDRLRELREKAGLTQADIAAKSDLHVNYYARIERGEVNPSFEKMQGILKALKIKSLDAL